MLVQLFNQFENNVTFKNIQEKQLTKRFKYIRFKA